MSVSNHLGLPFVAAAQSQKHVTVNDAFARLDVVVQASVLDMDLTAPPGSPAAGDRYIVAAPATADWAGQEDAVASFDGSGWVFFPPNAGWLVWATDQSKFFVYTGSSWTVASSGGGGGVTAAELADGTITEVGVNAASDTTNRLAVKSDAVLFDSAGTDSRVKVNKAGAANVASHLFQDGYSGRAEFGLIGDDDFTLKVSADGSTFTDAFTVDQATGVVDFNASPRVNGELLGLEDGRFGRTINAYDYGLRETASAATNTAALNAAAQAMKDVIVTGIATIPAVIYIPPGDYPVAKQAGKNTVWDLANIRSGQRFSIEGRGAILDCGSDCAGATVIDLIGSIGATGTPPEIKCYDSANAPAVGIQMGFSEDGKAVGSHRLNEIRILGYFSRAGVYNGAAEGCQFIAPTIWNFHASATAYCWIADGSTRFTPITDVSLAGLTPNAPRSNLLSQIVNGDFRRMVETLSALIDAPALWMTRCNQHTYSGCYFAIGTGSYGVVMKGDATAFSGCLFDNVHVETDPIAAFKFETYGGSCSIRHSRFNFNNARGTNAVFDVSALSTSVPLNLLDTDISLSNYNGGITGIFSHADRVNFAGGQVWLPNLTKWSEPAVFKGTLGNDTTLDARFDEVAAENFGTGHLSIDDDAVGEITPAATPCVVVLCSGVNNTKAALIWANPAASFCDIMVDPASKFEKGPGGVLTGTSATDGLVMVSSHTDGKIYINNRVGGTLLLDYAVLSGPLG